MQARRIGRFTLVRQVDADARSLLFEATDGTGRSMALRAFSPCLDDQGQLPSGTAFEDVGALCAMIRHPALCHVVEHGTDAAFGPWFARPWIDGTPLDSAPKLPTASAAQVLRGLAQALSVVHGFGIAHGQVNARHVVLPRGEPEHACLLDLGVALIATRQDATVSATKVAYDQPGLGLDPASDFLGLQRLAEQICAEPEPALLQAFEAAHASAAPFETLDRQLSTIRAPARAPRPRGHSVLVEDLSVPATMPQGRPKKGETSALDGFADGDGFEARYQPAGEIARGGMGAIVKAKDKRLGRDLVVKVLVNAEQAPQGLVHRFVREAQIQGQLEHPNICPVHELGVDASGQPYFVMKWVKGRALSELIKAGEPLERLLEVFMKVCDGVAFAHSRGIIHRDLKPDNIMVGEFSEVQVMDWGIAKALGDHSAPTHPGFGPTTMQPPLTMAGQAMGTPHFMPPEQARGDTDIDTRADIYALGAILYQILSGQRPVQGRSLPEILLAVMHNKIEAPSQRAPDSEVPADLEAACMKALAGDREQRYGTVLELKAEVRAFVDGRTLVAARYTSAERMAKWYGRNRTFARMALLAVSIAVVGAGALAIQRSQAQAQTRAQTAVLAERQLGEAQQLMTSGQWLRAQDSFLSAKKGFEALGQDTGRADFGLWQSRARVPPTALAHTNTGTISALRFLDDHRYITSSGHHVYIRDTLTGEILHRLTTGGPLIEMTRVSPDGRRIAVRVKGNGFVIWNADTGVRLRGVPARNVADFRLLSSQRVAYLTKSGALKVVELNNPGVTLMSASTAANQTLRASEDGRLLIAGANSHIAVFSSEDLSRIARQVTAVYTEDFAPRPDGSGLVIGTLTGAVLNMQINLHPERWMPGLEGPLHREHRHRVTQVEVSRRGGVVLTRDESGRTLIRAADSLEPTRELATNAQSVVRLAPSGDFAAIHTDGVTRFVSTRHDPTQRSVASAAEGFSATQVRFVGDGDVVAVLANVGLQFMWSRTLETFGFFDESPVPNPGYSALLERVSTRAYTLDDRGNHLLTRDGDRLFVQDILTARDPVSLPAFSGKITGQALAPGGQHAVIEASSSTGPRVVTIATASVSRPLPGTMLLAPAFSADGHLTVLGAAQPAPGSHKRGVIVWSLAEGAEVLRVAAHDKFVRAAAFSPDGDRLFTAGHDGQLLEVQMASGRVHRQLLQAEVPLSHVAVSHNARWLAASTDGGELHLIRLEGGEKVGTIKAADRTLRSLTFSPKDERLMLLDRTGRLTVLDLALEPDASATPADLLRSGLSGLGCALAARGVPQAKLHDPVTLLSCGAQWGDLGRQRALVDQAQRDDALPVAFAQVLHQSLPKAGAGVDLLGRTPLHWAAFQGDLDKVRQLLSEGADPLAQRSDGQTPVFAAVLGGSKAVVSALIEAGADLYDPKAPALDAAIYVGDAEMAKFLLDLGYDPRRTASPLGHAVGTAALVGDEALTKLLLEGTAVAGDELSALLVMVIHAGGPSNIVEALLKAGAPVDDGLGLGDPPLLAAVRKRSHALTRLLVDAGAKLEPTNRQGELPLHLAVKNGDLSIVSTLLGAGANANRRSPTGQTPLVLAIQEGHEAIVQALITAGAQPDLRDDYGRAPTHTALLAGRTALLVKLLDSGASMRTKNGRGISLLREAVRVADLEAVQALVARGAPDRPGPDGATALSEAQRLHRPAMVRALQHAQK